jgi:6-phosphogluconolactonase
MAERSFVIPLRREVRIFDDALAVTRAAALEFGRRAAERTEETGTFTVALSGGSTPRGLYALLAEQPPSPIPWANVHLFWGDERDVPPDHADSNFAMVQGTLLSKVGVPADHVHRIQPETGGAERAAAEYEEELRRFFRLAPGQWPRFDLVLLGMGSDGHTASLFPASPALEERERLVVSAYVEKLGARRVTLTLPVLNAAACVLFLLHGADKAEALLAVLEGDESPAPLPSRRVRPEAGELIWLVDRAAARLLARTSSWAD